jgi:hypothetical protein
MHSALMCNGRIDMPNQVRVCIARAAFVHGDIHIVVPIVTHEKSPELRISQAFDACATALVSAVLIRLTVCQRETVDLSQDGQTGSGSFRSAGFDPQHCGNIGSEQWFGRRGSASFPSSSQVRLHQACHIRPSDQ